MNRIANWILATDSRGRRTFFRWAVFPFMVVVMTAVLASFGRVWWCEEYDWSPWSWDVWTRHNSQHFLDPYTLSHIEHGIGLYLLLLLVLRSRMGVFSRAVAVGVVEAVWEIVENTDWMIQRYRTVTIALDYCGDSILNSLADFVACMAGVLMAMRLPLWVSCTILVGLETISTLWIRDSLLLNILMLLYPIEAIRQWQMEMKP